jgi:pyrimidine operon attenuation protein/uracil phosphoribosyltransferase
MPTDQTRIADASGLERALADLTAQIARGRRADVPLRLVGVRTRGVPIAQRIADALGRGPGGDVPVGAVDITLYRDDLGDAGHWPVLHGTEIPFPVDGAEIVLVDDVLFTGRTVRAALNTVCDLGRPARVRLACLVDRGGRELPIAADYVGLRCPVGPAERVLVRLRPVDSADEILRVPSRA